MQIFSAVRGAIPCDRVRHASALSALWLLAACATPAAEPTTPPADGAMSGACRAAAAEFAVGRAYTEELGASLQQAAQAKTLRVIRPGDAVTMDYRDDRLNVELDAGGKVSKVRCG
ncbi:I78 family peptidase inhibitor [Phenylobacterium sp. LjRoot219]|uniref:I78 family peptidase inhibitor n=1 Tax=Phenylobacterium sp. LjRoot219 TaxID=3342283 RepID=UPI003ECFB81F